MYFSFALLFTSFLQRRSTCSFLPPLGTNSMILVKQERLFGWFYVVLHVKVHKKLPNKMEVLHGFENHVTPTLIARLDGWHLRWELEMMQIKIKQTGSQNTYTYAAIYVKNAQSLVISHTTLCHTNCHSGNGMSLGAFTLKTRVWKMYTGVLRTSKQPTRSTVWAPRDGFFVEIAISRLSYL